MLKYLIKQYAVLVANNNATITNVHKLMKGYRFHYTNYTDGDSTVVDMVTVKMFYYMVLYFDYSFNFLEHAATTTCLNNIIRAKIEEERRMRTYTLYAVNGASSICDIISSYIYPINTLHEYQPFGKRVGNMPAFSFFRRSPSTIVCKMQLKRLHWHSVKN